MRLRNQPTKSDMPITPMFDVTIQLLTFFELTLKTIPSEGALPS